MPSARTLTFMLISCTSPSNNHLRMRFRLETRRRVCAADATFPLWGREADSLCCANVDIWHRDNGTVTGTVTVPVGTKSSQHQHRLFHTHTIAQTNGAGIFFFHALALENRQLEPIILIIIGDLTGWHTRDIFLHKTLIQVVRPLHQSAANSLVRLKKQTAQQNIPENGDSNENSEITGQRVGEKSKWKMIEANFLQVIKKKKVEENDYHRGTNDVLSAQPSSRLWIFSRGTSPCDSHLSEVARQPLAGPENKRLRGRLMMHRGPRGRKLWRSGGGCSHQLLH